MKKQKNKVKALCICLQNKKNIQSDDVRGTIRGTYDDLFYPEEASKQLRAALSGIRKLRITQSKPTRKFF